MLYQRYQYSLKIYEIRKESDKKRAMVDTIIAN